MPTIDMNELRKRNPVEYHRRMLLNANGRLMTARDKVDDARNSVERERAERKVNQAKAEGAFHRRSLELLKA